MTSGGAGPARDHNPAVSRAGHNIPAGEGSGTETPSPAGCDLCGGAGWVAVPDSLMNGALVDSRCPCCCDLSVRSSKSMWERDDGHRVGPQRNAPDVQTHVGGGTSNNQERG